MDITAAIKVSNKSRRDICREVGISQAHLSLIENGHRKVGLKNIVGLANSLGCSPAQLRPDIYEKIAP